MLRRFLNLLLLGVCGLLLAGGWLRAELNLRHALLLLVLLTAGLALNLSGLLLAHVNLRSWLRVLAAGLGLLIAGGFVVTRQNVLETLAQQDPRRPSLPLQQRAELQQAAVGLGWLAAAAAYAGLAALALPPRRVASAPAASAAAPSPASESE